MTELFYQDLRNQFTVKYFKALENEFLFKQKLELKKCKILHTNFA